MENNWNKKFLENQISQLWTRTEDDTSWQDKDLPDWDTFIDTSTNIVINALNEKFNDWTLLDRSFSEDDSQYISFAGNYAEGGFLLFTTKIFDKVFILTQIQAPANNRLESFISINHIEDYANDTFGQLFLITQDLNLVRHVLVISNPFVTDAIDFGNLLLIQNLILTSDNFENIKWKTDSATQIDWDNFCRLENTQFKVTTNTASDSYVEDVTIVCYQDTFRNEYGAARIIVFNYNWYGESTLRITKEIFGYTTRDIHPAIDVKTYNKRSFITTNIAETSITTHSTFIKANKEYWNIFWPKDVKYQLTSVIKTLGAGQYQRARLWEHMQILSTGEMTTTYSWVKAYYDWIRQYNGWEFLSVSEDIQFIFVLGWTPQRDEEKEVYPNLIPVFGETDLTETLPFDTYDWINGPYKNERWSWYKGSINSFLTRDKIIDAGFHVNLQTQDGNGGTPGDNQWINRVTAFLVRDYDTTIERESNSDLNGPSMFVSGNNILNISFEKGFTQNLFVKGEDGQVVTSTFTITPDGEIEITEENLIHQVPYSLEFFNIPSLISETELYIGYIQNQSYPQIDYLVWSYDDDGNVIDKSPIKSIMPLSQVAKSVYTYFLKNEVIFRIVDSLNKIHIGVLYLKDKDRIFNIKELGDNQRLFSYFKDDNSIQIRNIGMQNLWAELSYTSTDEPTIYFRAEKNNQIDNFNLMRIGLLANDFLLSDNTITNKNMTQVTAYALLGTEALNYITTTKINLFNNNNVEILTSQLNFSKNQWDEYLLGFQININTPNNWKNWFDQPDKLKLTQLSLNNRVTQLQPSNFSQTENTLKIGFGAVGSNPGEVEIELDPIKGTYTVSLGNTFEFDILNQNELINLKVQRNIIVPIPVQPNGHYIIDELLDDTDILIMADNAPPSGYEIKIDASSESELKLNKQFPLTVEVGQEITDLLILNYYEFDNVLITTEKNDNNLIIKGISVGQDMIIINARDAQTGERITPFRGVVNVIDEPTTDFEKFFFGETGAIFKNKGGTT